MAFRLAFLFVALVLSLARPASAEDPVLEAQQIIAGQISALKTDDARAAYSFASPGIRSMFPDERVFLTMVRERYEPLYHAVNYAFGRSKLVGGGEVVFQEVILSGRGAKDHTAIYDMRLQDDGTYKVNGVRMLAKTTSQGI